MTDLEGWEPKRVAFEDWEIVQALRATPEGERKGNLWTFYENLPAPERDRLAREAEAAPGTAR